ncbi:FOG: EAL domain [Hahella chejuensis KCTC 2396]|uniref:cyclic-guanylate-specific phosphodiesterase n=2 Tax=Hahella chejuensis TaxID=158327 RepID=Q2SFK1_HAHCH|nr:FOG: EAL domain [Hahella chejuensis KCTC 2396]
MQQGRRENHKRVEVMLTGTEILIVEDSLTQALQLQMLLEQNNCIVTVAENGVQALKCIAERRPTIIVSDIMMPEMDGYTLCRTLKSDPKTESIPVILVTTLTDPKDVVQGLIAGADNFITKPYDEKYLLSRIRYFLANLEHRDHQRVKMGIEIILDGERHFINSARQQILDLLISTYEEGIRLNRELKAKHEELSHTHSLINSLFHFTAGLSAASTEKDTIEQGLGQVLSFPNVIATWLLLVDADLDDGGWRLAGYRGDKINSAQLDPCGRECPCRHGVINDGLTGAVDIADCPAMKGVFISNHHATIPLLLGGEVIGLLNVARTEGERWAEESLRALQSLGHQFSVALGRARLFDSLESLVEQRTSALKAEMAEKERAQEQLKLRNRAVDASVNAIIIADKSEPDNPIVYANPAFERISGYNLEDVTGRNFLFLLGNETSQLGVANIKRALKSNTEGYALLKNYRKDGTLFWSELKVAPVTDAKGDVTHFVAILNDVTESIQYQAQLEYKTKYDNLTGLPNRNLLNDRIQQAIAYAARRNKGFALAVFDLDNFKYINDSMGHETGDQLLTEVAESLRSCLREGDTLARLGGDEFVILMHKEECDRPLGLMLNRIQQLVSQPRRLKDKEILVTPSIGVCQFPEDGEDASTLLKNADTAMYKAKERGRNRICSYTQEMNESIQKRVQMEQDLRRGIENGELELYYQPQLDPHGGGAVGLEALVRWRKGDRMVPPLEFIPIAEETGLITEVDAWVLRAACLQLKMWRDQKQQMVPVSVNLSPRQFQDAYCVELVRKVLQESNIEPGCLKIEVTESMVMHNAEEALRTMTQLKAMGVQLSMDDFGTGYSSLSYLKMFPFDQLKIDKSFVRNVTNDPQEAAIIRAIIGLGKTLGIKIVAEGVETVEQYSFLVRAGCDLIQGYFYSPPLPVAACMHFLQEDHLWGKKRKEIEDGPQARRILIVNDDETILRAVCGELGHEGYDIFEAHTLAEALRLLAAHEMHVVVADQCMKEIKGVDLLRKVKAIHPSTVRMVLSGYSGFKDVLEAINEGAVFRFITKPWNSEHLRENVKQAFRESDLARENQMLREQLDILRSGS